MMVNLQKRRFVSSTIVGLFVGALASRISTPLLFSTRFDWLADIGFFSPYIIPPIFLGVFTYLLLKRYPHIWGDANDRILCICLTLLGFSIGWHMIALPTLILKGKAPNSLLALFRFFSAGLILSPFTILVAPILGIPSILAIIIMSYFITKGLEIKHRVLVTLLLILLVFWPSALILVLLAE